MEHFQIVATGFRAAGLILGIPSLCAVFFFGLLWFQMTPVHVSQPLPGESQNLITLLMGSVRFLAKIAGFFAEISRVVLAVVVAVSACLAAFSAGLYFTGRGLAAHQAWARISGMTLAFVLVAMWITGLIPMRWGPISLALTASACYTLWVLWRLA